jgi:hypothetical protein
VAPAVPLVAPLLVTGIFFAVARTEPDKILHLLQLDVNKALAGAESTPERLLPAMAAHRAWLASMAVNTSLMLGVLAVSLVLLWTFWKARQRHKVLTVGLVFVGLSVLLGILFRVQPRLFMGAFAAEALEIADRTTHGDGAYLLTLSFLVGVSVTSVILALALAAILRNARAATKGATAAVVRAMAQMRVLLALATLWLITGVAGTHLAYRWFAALAGINRAKAIDILSQIEVVDVGVLFTLVLAAAFGSMELLLRNHAFELAHVSGHDNHAKWLADNGLSGSVAGTLGKVLAILSPLITALVQGVVELPKIK